MLAIVLAPIYIIINIYVLRWALRWAGACHGFLQSRYFRYAFITVYMFLCSTLLTSFLIKRPEALHRTLKIISNYWLGIFAYILLAIVTADLIRLAIKRFHWMRTETFASRKLFVASGALTASAIIAVSAYGILHMNHIYTTEYDVFLDKPLHSGSSMNIVLVSDFHLGYHIGSEQMERMAKKINRMDADIVCIAGDIFDNEYDAIKEPQRIQRALKSIKSKYGVYACYGNHDLNEEILVGFTFDSDGGNSADKEDPRMEQLLKNSGVTLLRDESIYIDDAFYVVGRKDPARTRKLADSRLSPDALLAGLDRSKPIIVIDHQPRELQELADAGADLDLSGHTHDGQLFPATLLVDMAWENACGLIKKDQMHSIVTSGIGVWGPAMRVGANSEIVKIKVHFQ